MHKNDNAIDFSENRGKFCYTFIPARFVFIFMGFIGFNLLYSYKVALSVALVAMVSHSSNSSSSSSECEIIHKNNTNTTTVTKGELDWTDDQQAMILGAFFYGYAVTQIPGGMLAERFGAKWVLGGSILATALLSLIGPLAARRSFVAFFVTRVGQGLTEGLVFPSMIAMFARWLPKMERSLGSTIVFTGAQLGTVITYPLAGYLCDGKFMDGWPAIFYLTGIAGCIWFLLWALLIHETPEEHPHISFKELDYIKKGQGDEKVSKHRKIRLSKIFTSIPMWALIITHFGNNWGLYTTLTLMPTYFQKILLMDIKHNGLFSSLPWLLSALMGWIAGLIADKVRSTNRFSINLIRKISNSIGYIGPALCFVAVALSGCNTTSSIIFSTMALGLNGFVYSGFMCTHVDMAPDLAGTLFGITNTIASFPGFLAPSVANLLTKNNQTLKNWSYVFYLSAAIYFGASLIYIFFASANLQPWGISHSVNNDNNENFKSEENKAKKTSNSDYETSNHNNIAFVPDSNKSI